MKKNCKFLFMQAAIVAMAMIIVPISCGHDDEDEAFIKVNGLSTTTLTFDGLFGSKSGIDFKQTVRITSNTEWSAYDIPNWLSVSPSNGNEEMTMTIYPKSENESSETRKATIRIVGGDKSATIIIEQEAGRVKAKATPSGVVALYNQIAFEMEVSNNVNKFQYAVLSESSLNRLTEKELLALLREIEEFKVADDYMFFPMYDYDGYKLQEGSTYYICTVAYDNNDNIGEIVKSPITIPAWADADKDAWVNLSNIQYGSYSFQFTATKEGLCDNYHIIYGNLPLGMNFPGAAFAFEINYFLKNGKKHWLSENYDLEIITNYINNHTFTYFCTYSLTSRPLITIYAWGVFKNGTVSSDIIGDSWDTSEGNVKMRQKGRRTEEIKNVVIRRSEIERMNVN